MNQWRACDRAGLGRRIGWHVLRHTFASHLVSLGVPLRAVQELLGHADVKMTMRYAHLAPRERSRAIRLLDSASTAASQESGERRRVTDGELCSGTVAAPS